MVTTAAAGADLIEAVPGDPARVREVATSWLETSHTVGEALESTATATRATPSWEGLSARAFAAHATAVGSGLGQVAERMRFGADVLNGYAAFLQLAQAEVEALRAQARCLHTVGGAGALPEMATLVRARADVMTRLHAAALNAAARLQGGSEADAGDSSNGEDNKKGRDPERSKPFGPHGLPWINDQITGKYPVPWSTTKQGEIGDCFFLAALYSVTQDPEEEKRLRENVTWNEDEKAYEVKLYDSNGEQRVVLVHDYYTNGAYSPGPFNPSLINIYERAYSTLYGTDYVEGGQPQDALLALTGKRPSKVDNYGKALGFIPYPGDTYDDDEWEKMEEAVDEERPVVASSGSSSSRMLPGVADVTGDGHVDQSDVDAENGGTRDFEFHSWHGYSVVEMDEDTVTLRNPWANSKEAGDDGFGHDANGDGHIIESDGENHGDRVEGTGVIRISREDYEKFFESTEIGG